MTSNSDLCLPSACTSSCMEVEEGGQILVRGRLMLDKRGKVDGSKDTKRRQKPWNVGKLHWSENTINSIQSKADC